MKTYYIKKVDKPRIRIVKFEQNDCEVYIKKDKKIKKIIEKFQKKEVNYVVLDKELKQNKNFVNALNANDIRIFDGRWLIKYLNIEILEYIVNNSNFNKEEIEIAITTDEISDFAIESIKILAKQYKKLTVVTSHIEKLRKIEKEIYDKEGIIIIISNNVKKSLVKAKIILNLDFNYQKLNRYKINENAIIVNLEGNMKIENKRFNGININDYEVQIGREEITWRDSQEKFYNKDLFESAIYVRDTYNNIRKMIKKNKVEIKELYGLNGKIERFS